MFGFLKPVRRIPKWRQSYARICQLQRKLFGLTSLPFLSYEATFLYQLAVDHSLVPELGEDAPQCCRLRRLPSSESSNDDVAASFAAAFGVLLAGIKLQDDVQDSGRWFNRFLRWKYRRQVQSAARLIEECSPGVSRRIEAAIDEHARLEQRRTGIAIDEYAEPTGEGFSAVFEAFIYATGSSAALDCRAQCTEIGHLVGKAIICWDCAVDFDRDRIKGDFNPLTNATEVKASLDACLMNLATIGWMLPDGSVSRDVIASVATRVRSRRFAEPIPHPVRRLERWGLLRERGYSYAKCDGCDALCAVGECCECIGGAGEVAAAGSSCDFCCCDCFCCASNSSCGDCGPPQKATAESAGLKSADGPTPYAEHHGKHGTADSVLNPSGYVRIGEQRLPAKSHSGTMIGSGKPVTVVRTDAFGVSVVERVTKENA